MMYHGVCSKNIVAAYMLLVTIAVVGFSFICAVLPSYITLAKTGTSVFHNGFNCEQCTLYRVLLEQ